MNFRVSQLAESSRPWILRLVCETIDPPKMELELWDFGVTAWVLDANHMRTVDELFDIFASRLSFPEYFGHNWAALDECLADLDWIPLSPYVVVIKQSALLLRDEADSELRRFLDIIEGVAEGWATPVCRNEEWDRPEIPFHLVLQESPEGFSSINARLNLNVSFPQIAWDLGDIR